MQLMWKLYFKEYKIAVNQLTASDLERSLGLLLLTVSIIKKLHTSEKTIQKLWMNKSFSIFKAVFTLLTTGILLIY